MTKPTVLVAGTMPAITTVRALLGTEVDTIAARSLDEARRALQTHPDVILCNVRFDESRMLDLLQAAKEEVATRDTPFICLRLSRSPPRWRRILEVAVLAAGATAFVDLSSLEKERELRALVLSHLQH